MPTECWLHCCPVVCDIVTNDDDVLTCDSEHVHTYTYNTHTYNTRTHSAKILVKGEPNVSYICSRYYRAPELIFGATDYTCDIG